ncbi:MAG: GNAT family N-acetyltransferase [Micropepsaceae bacterium]
MTTMELVKPTASHLPGYTDALTRGWSPDNIRGKAAADEQLARIAADAIAFIHSLDDPEAKGTPVKLLDGTEVPRLPGFVRWIWDDEFCGSINLRWQKGTSALPPHVLGHIGYSVVPWKQGRGYATQALAMLLPQARLVGLDHIELTTQPDNIPSQRVITSNGGVLVERFVKSDAHGGKESLRWRITLAR